MKKMYLERQREGRTEDQKTRFESKNFKHGYRKMKHITKEVVKL